MSISGSFKLRKVLTLKTKPQDSTEPFDMSNVFKPTMALPRPLELPSYVNTCTVVVGKDDLLQFKVVATKIEKPSSAHSTTPAHYVFGRSLEVKSIPLLHPKVFYSYIFYLYSF